MKSANDEWLGEFSFLISSLKWEDGQIKLGFENQQAATPPLHIEEQHLADESKKKKERKESKVDIR
jgi:hypothetical protein